MSDPPLRVRERRADTEMHIFCDESGGTGEKWPCFLITAVAIDHYQAGHVISRLRKRAGVIGEPHGTDLDARQRERFLRTLHDRDDGVAVAVVLRWGSPLSGILASKTDEAVVRTHMVAEAVAAIRA